MLAGPPRVAGSLLRLSLAIAIGYAGLAGGLAYWQVIQAQSLTTDPLNPIVIAAARSAPRGTIYDSGGAVLARNVPGNVRQREYPVPALRRPWSATTARYMASAGLEKT